MSEQWGSRHAEWPSIGSVARREAACSLRQQLTTHSADVWTLSSSSSSSSLGLCYRPGCGTCRPSSLSTATASFGHIVSWPPLFCGALLNRRLFCILLNLLSVRKMSEKKFWTDFEDIFNEECQTFSFQRDDSDILWTLYSFPGFLTKMVSTQSTDSSHALSLSKLKSSRALKDIWLYRMSKIIIITAGRWRYGFGLH